MFVLGLRSCPSLPSVPGETALWLPGISVQIKSQRWVVPVSFFFFPALYPPLLPNLPHIFYSFSVKKGENETGRSGEGREEERRGGTDLNTGPENKWKLFFENKSTDAYCTQWCKQLAAAIVFTWKSTTTVFLLLLLLYNMNIYSLRSALKTSILLPLFVFSSFWHRSCLPCCIWRHIERQINTLFSYYFTFFPTLFPIFTPPSHHVLAVAPLPLIIFMPDRERITDRERNNTCPFSPLDWQQLWICSMSYHCLN